MSHALHVGHQGARSQFKSQRGGCVNIGSECAPINIDGAVSLSHKQRSFLIVCAATEWFLALGAATYTQILTALA